MANDPRILDENNQPSMRVLTPTNEFRNVRTGSSGQGMGMAFSERLDPVNDGILSYPFGHNFTLITTAATTVVKSTTGTIRNIRVLGGTLGAITVYDNSAASGAKIVDAITPTGPTILADDITFANGLTIVTAAATQVLVEYR